MMKSSRKLIRKCNNRNSGRT